MKKNPFSLLTFLAFGATIPKVLGIVGYYGEFKLV